MYNQKLIRLNKEVRTQRAVDTVQALKYMSGGAMQTDNMGDVTPKFIILATTNTGNHPFSHVATAKGGFDKTAQLNVAGIEEVIEDYRDTFIGKVFIGKRSGFWDEEDENLKILVEKYKDLVMLGTVNGAIDAYCEQIKKQLDE